MNIISVEEGEGGRVGELCITKQAVRFSVRKLYVCSHVCVCVSDLVKQTKDYFNLNLCHSAD